jgi:hypothetical protein
MGMTYRVQMKAAAVAAASSLLLAGCSASVAPSTVGPADKAAAGNSAAISQQVSNISGDYVGTVHDAQGGAGTAKATLAQHIANAGGAANVKQAHHSIIVNISLTITSANATSGAMVIDFPPAKTGPACTFSTTGTYDRATNVLSGSYSAVTGCTGDTGTYKLTQQCHDTVVTGGVDRWMNNPHC